VTEAYSAARELLERAEQDAARIRSEADRYRRQREQEAELLVAKARRLLEMAEARAATIAAPPAVGATAEPAVVDLAGLETADGDAPVVPTGLDRMLRSAITRAFDGSFHFGR
jgi:hypothetical protein